MPPKVKITRDDIVKTALSLVAKNGVSAINARSIADAIGCSTQPIFSNFATMEGLHEAVIDAAYQYYLAFLEKESQKSEYPVYKAYGMAYIRFAEEEKELFKLLFMCDRTGKPMEETEDFKSSVAMIMRANGVCEETAWRMHFEMWVFVHGIGTMLATSYLKLDRETISSMLSDVYQGIRQRLVEKGEENVRD